TRRSAGGPSPRRRSWPRRPTWRRWSPRRCIRTNARAPPPASPARTAAGPCGARETGTCFASAAGGATPGRPRGPRAPRPGAREPALGPALGGGEDAAARPRQLLARAEGKGHRLAAEIYQTRLSETESQAEVIRRVLLERKPDAPDAIPPPEGETQDAQA